MRTSPDLFAFAVAASNERRVVWFWLKASKQHRSGRIVFRNIGPIPFRSLKEYSRIGTAFHGDASGERERGTAWVGNPGPPSHTAVAQSADADPLYHLGVVRQVNGIQAFITRSSLALINAGIRPDQAPVRDSEQHAGFACRTLRTAGIASDGTLLRRRDPPRTGRPLRRGQPTLSRRYFSFSCPRSRLANIGRAPLSKSRAPLSIS